jgi:hypothetical protein
VGTDQGRWNLICTLEDGEKSMFRAQILGNVLSPLLTTTDFCPWLCADRASIALDSRLFRKPLLSLVGPTVPKFLFSPGF